MAPSDSRPCPATVIYSRRQSLEPHAMESSHTVGSLRFLADLSTPAVPYSPRVAHPLHMLVASRTVSGFTIFWKVDHYHWRNEAETGSLSLRLTSSPSRAPTTRLPAPPPSWLHGERAIAMVSTFQLTRSTRLSLTNQSRTTQRRPILAPLIEPGSRSRTPRKRRSQHSPGPAVVFSAILLHTLPISAQCDYNATDSRGHRKPLKFP